MIEDIDIYRTANLMIKQYGDEAVKEALKQSEEFKYTNSEGSLVWRKIANAAQWLSSSEVEDQAAN